MNLDLYPTRDAKRHYCGEFGMLTMREIMRRTGRAEATIRSRIARGVTGAALATNPPRKSQARRYRDAAGASGGSGTVHGGMFIACRIARSLRTRDDIPSIASLMDRFNMSRATAYRWRAAWLAAMGMDHA